MQGKYATEYIFYTPLTAAGAQDYQSNPTIAAGDFQVSTDGSSWTNLDTLPTLSPAADIQVKITVSIAEMTGKKVTIRAIDAAGAEWEDDFWEIDTYGHASAQHVFDLSQATPDVNVASIDTDAVDAASLKADAVTEIQTGLATAPTGARAITLHFQEADTTSIPDVLCSIRNAGDSATLWVVGPSDINGDIDVSLDDASYNLRPTKAAVTWTVPHALTVSADATENVTGTVQAPSAPSASSLCVIYGTIRDAAGDALSGATVEVHAVTPQTVSGVQLSGEVESTTTNSSGYFEIEAQRLSEVRLVIRSVGVDETLTVPDAASQDVTSWA